MSLLNATIRHPSADPLFSLQVITMSSTINYYEVLQVPTNCTFEDVKRAYHNALLRNHPDKTPGSSTDAFDASLLKAAYTTLSSSELRSEYDATLSRSYSTNIEKRPAQIISLENFIQEEGVWRYRCRCSSWYKIVERQLEDEVHLIGCEGCSEVIYVGYEEADEVE